MGLGSERGEAGASANQSRHLFTTSCPSPQKVPESDVSLQCGPASMLVPQFVATGQVTGISTLESNRKNKLTEPLATPSVSRNECGNTSIRHEWPKRHPGGTDTHTYDSLQPAATENLRLPATGDFPSAVGQLRPVILIQ